MHLSLRSKHTNNKKNLHIKAVISNYINFRGKVSDILVINLKGTSSFYGGFPIIAEKEKEEKVCMGI